MKYFSKYKTIKEKIKEIEDTANNKYKGNPAFAKRVNYATARENNTVDDKMIMYESFYGRGMVCNPYALFKCIYADSRFKDYRHIWVLDDFEQHKVLMEEYKSDSNVSFVEIDTIEYFNYLSKAKYLINNSTWKTYYTAKEEQVVINTWHGTPLKSMGYDMENGNIEVSNTVRNYLMTDYLLSANKLMTYMYRTAYKMDGIYKGEIIEEGYPRNDLIFDTDKSEFIKKVKKIGLNIDENKKLVVYAPTWKGDTFSNPEINVDEYKDAIKKIYEEVNEEEYQVLFKPHQVVYKTLAEQGKLEDYFIPATVDTNELLSVTDILISDYSSIFFDFLCTGRPVLFYIPDLEKYEEIRKLYIRPEELPGPITKDISQIGKWIANISNYKEMFDYSNYEKVKKLATEHDDGEVSRRVIDRIFFKSNDAKIFTDFSTDKKRLLIFNDNMKTNGITSSLLNLLGSLDYNKYDITLYAGGSTEDAKTNLCRVNSNVRVIYKNSMYNATLKEEIRLRTSLYLGLERRIYRRFFTRELFEREMKRNFGYAEFDYIIDFIGYSPFFAYMFTVDKKAKKLIWLHNDMVAERARFEDGDKKFKVIASAYPYYDKLVSCAESVNEVNYNNLAKPSTKDKFTFAKNMMTKDRIEKSLQMDMIIEYNDKDYYIQQVNEQGEKTQIAIIDNVDKSYTNFVNVGRLSMEKNQKNLILGFEKMHKLYPKTRLYILGDGPLKQQLRKLVKDRGLSDSVLITGNVDNPFNFINMCDCFVLPSNHEGQPMAILEARILRKPIIVSDFSTVKGSLYEKGQYLVTKDPDGICEGLTAFMEGNVPNEYVFDLDQYNREAVQEFENNLN